MNKRSKIDVTTISICNIKIHFKMYLTTTYKSIKNDLDDFLIFSIRPQRTILLVLKSIVKEQFLIFKKYFKILRNWLKLKFFI